MLSLNRIWMRCVVGAVLIVGVTLAIEAAPSGATARPSGAPIVVGVANADTGVAAFPAAAQTAAVAEDYINKVLGGIHGRPLKLVYCDMSDDAPTAQACGEQFAHTPSMKAAIVVAVVNGGPFYSVMHSVGIPVLGGFALTPADDSPPSTYFYYAGYAGFYYGLANLIKSDKSIHSISLISSSAAETEAGVAIFKSLLPSDITLNSQTPTAGATDLTPYVAAAGISTSNVTINLAGSCPTFVQALSSLSLTPKLVIVLSSCATPAQVLASPSTYAGWYFLSPGSKIPGVDLSNPQVKLLNQEWKKYGPGGTIGSFGELGWGEVMTLRSILSSLPASKLSSSSAINTALRSYKGPVIMGANSISCPGPAPYKATCSFSDILYRVSSSGQLVIVPGISK